MKVNEVRYDIKYLYHYTPKENVKKFYGTKQLFQKMNMFFYKKFERYYKSIWKWNDVLKQVVYW